MRESVEYLIPRGKSIAVQHGDRVEKGDFVYHGHPAPHDILAIKGVEELANYLINEIQDVYRLQGVTINDKHIEVIVRQMLQKVEIEDPGETDLLKGEQIDKIEFDEKNAAFEKAGKRVATANRIAFCTDDRDPEDIADNGHVNGMVRDAVAAGIDPADAILMASFHPALWHGLTDHGAVAPGFVGDLLLLPDLETFLPDLVLKRGRRIDDVPTAEVPEWVRQTVRLKPVTAADFAIPWEGGSARAIGLITDQVVTESLEVDPLVVDGHVISDPERDLVKLAVAERHLGTGRIGMGLVSGSGLQRGALASTVAHDAHNLVVVGADDEDMAAAANRLAEVGGGIVVVDGGRVVAECPLPVAGLLSDQPLDIVVSQSRGCNDAAQQLGWVGATPFLTLAFLALSVIPSLKLTDRGLVEVDRFEIVPLAFGALAETSRPARD